jgi:hypothetical protein
MFARARSSVNCWTVVKRVNTTHCAAEPAQPCVCRQLAPTPSVIGVPTRNSIGTSEAIRSVVRISRTQLQSQESNGYIAGTTAESLRAIDKYVVSPSAGV